MKSYFCKECSNKGKRFIGGRREVRLHLRTEHLIKKNKTKQMGSIKLNQKEE